MQEFAFFFFSPIFLDFLWYVQQLDEWEMKLYIQYRSKVSWHSKLETRSLSLDVQNVRGLILKYMYESPVSRIESRGWRNKAFSNMQKLERVSTKWFISRRKNNTVLLTPKVQMFRADCYHMKTFNHTMAD